MTESVKAKFDNLQAMIGNTPLAEINYEYKGEKRRIYAKIESFNLTGSIKDRVAFYVLKKAYEQGDIHEGDEICEATSGNTGISFSGVGSYLGHHVVIYMPDWMSRERITLMQSYGAEVRLVSHEQGGFLGSIKLADDYAAERGNVFLPHQFSNEDNTEAHIASTAEEIARQLKLFGAKPDCFIAGVGTGGTVMGVGRRLRRDFPELTVHPLEPLNSPTLSTGCKVGNHRIQGISDEFIPPILHMDELNEIISVDDGDSIIMARLLAERLGVGVGVSSGANFIGAVMLQNMFGGDKTVVTTFADDCKKYLSTDYSNPPEMQKDSLLHSLKLTGMRTVR